MERLKLLVLGLAKRLRRLRGSLRRSLRAVEKQARRFLGSVGEALDRRQRKLRRKFPRVTHLVVAWNPWYGPENECRRCPACDGSALVHLEPLHLRWLGGKRRVGFMTGCRGCGVLFSNPPPDPRRLAEMYSPGGDWDTRDQDESGREAGVHANKLALVFASAAPELDVLAPPPGARALDFGCGSGGFLNSLQDHGWETYGIEPATKVAFRRHRELAAPPSEPMVQLVILHHVLEHVPGPLDVLRSIAAALEPGGCLYISVPSLDNLPRHRDLAYCLNGHAHINSFSRDCLRNLLARAGMLIVDDLDSAEADRRLTGGAPTRMRALARKQPVASPASSPLRGAQRALRAYRASSGLGRQVLPVRLRASRLNRGPLPTDI